MKTFYRLTLVMALALLGLGYAQPAKANTPEVYLTSSWGFMGGANQDVTLGLQGSSGDIYTIDALFENNIGQVTNVELAETMNTLNFPGNQYLGPEFTTTRQVTVSNNDGAWVRFSGFNQNSVWDCGLGMLFGFRKTGDQIQIEVINTTGTNRSVNAEFWSGLTHQTVELADMYDSALFDSGTEGVVLATRETESGEIVCGSAEWKWHEATPTPMPSPIVTSTPIQVTIAPPATVVPTQVPTSSPYPPTPTPVTPIPAPTQPSMLAVSASLSLTQSPWQKKHSQYSLRLDLWASQEVQFYANEPMTSSCGLTDLPGGFSSGISTSASFAWHPNLPPNAPGGACTINGTVKIWGRDFSVPVSLTFNVPYKTFFPIIKH